jgi:cytidyltransferase-like protein
MTETNQQLKSALEHLAAKRIDEAERLLREVLRQQPHLMIAILSLAQIALYRGEGKGSIETLQKILHDHPYLDYGYYLLAQCYQQNRQLPQAAQSFYHAFALLSLGSNDHDEYPPAQQQRQPQDSVLALNTLWQLLSQLKQQNLPAFATAGTLLGLERNGALLPNDKDIDIGVDWIYLPRVIEFLQAQGWQEQDRSYGLINPRCFAAPNGIVADICAYATEVGSNTTISGLWMDGIPFGWNRITCFPKLELGLKPSPAGTVYHLKNSHELLAALYGNDWQIEDSDFDTIVSAPNIKAFSWLARCYAYSRLYYNLKHGKQRRALRIIETVLRHQPRDPLLISLQQRLLSQLAATPPTAMQAARPRRVLALGYFDLLHIGHLNYLNYAKRQGEVLVVGVAPDAFCQKSKGYSPVINQQQRMAMIAAIKGVDELHLVAVPMAESAAAAAWIASLKIDQVICGAEWQGSERWQRLEASLSPYGITVHYAPATVGISSSQIKQRIASGARGVNAV